LNKSKSIKESSEEKIDEVLQNIEKIAIW
jgi:hypothetical protein